MCWVDSEARWAGVGLKKNADGAEKRRRRMWWYGRRGTEVPGMQTGVHHDTLVCMWLKADVLKRQQRKTVG